jgi:hypothetical protein
MITRKQWSREILLVTIFLISGFMLISPLNLSPFLFVGIGIATVVTRVSFSSKDDSFNKAHNSSLNLIWVKIFTVIFLGFVLPAGLLLISKRPFSADFLRIYARELWLSTVILLLTLVALYALARLILEIDLFLNRKSIAKLLVDLKNAGSTNEKHSLIQIQTEWKKILAVMGQHDRPTAVLLNYCEVVGLEDCVLQLRTDAELVFEKLNNHSPTRQRVSNVLTEVVGYPYSVKCKMGKVPGDYLAANMLTAELWDMIQEDSYTPKQ